MPTKDLSVSIVIPVYNEEAHLKNCLDAIADQTVKPLEVIVVDNNSTDKSVEIAEKYRFVKILHEPKQHQTYAQVTGFDAAKGDIIGRIDGDSIVMKGWVEAVQKHFAGNADTIAVSGRPEPYDIGAKYLGTFIFYIYHNLLNRLMFRSNMLWGANCAFRASYWSKARPQLTLSPRLWEDYDLSFVLMQFGRIDYLDDVTVGCSFRPVHKSFGKQFEYHMRHVRTVAIHRPKMRLPSLIFVFGTKLVFIYPITVIDKYVVRPFTSRKSNGSD